MGRQWRTRYPLPEHTVRRLRRARWLFAGMTLVYAARFAWSLTRGISGWRLWIDGCGLCVFAGLSLLGLRLLARHEVSLLKESAPPPVPTVSDPRTRDVRRADSAAGAAREAEPGEAARNRGPGR